jgi:hypothetical protein
VIVFDSVLNGGVTVSYETTAIVWYDKRGFADYANKKNIYRLSYLSEVLEESIEFCNTSTGSDGSEVTYETNDACSVRVDQNPSKSAPFNFYTNGTVKSMIWIVDKSSTPKHFYTNLGNVGHYRTGGATSDTGFVANMTSSSVIEQASVRFKVEPLGSLKYGGRLAKGIAPTSCTIGMRTVNFTLNTSNSKYNTYYMSSNIELGKTVTVTYQRAVTKYTVPTIGESNIIGFEINACNGIVAVEFPDVDKDEYESCEIPSTRQIDIASLLSVSVAAAAGKVVTSTTLAEGTWTVDNKGAILVNITTADYHIIDCGNVKKNAKIYIDSRDAETTP